MLKILIANQNIRQNDSYCNYLENEDKLKKEFHIDKTYTGQTTLSTYQRTQPNIMIMDSDFNDIDYKNILKRLSISVDEKKKCNVILTTNSLNNDFATLEVSKIYKILLKPFNYKELFNTIKLIQSENRYPKFDIIAVYKLLLSLNFSLSYIGTQFLIQAIEYCYYFPFSLEKLDEIFKKIAFENNTSPEKVKYAIINSLKPLNKYRNYLSSPILNIFNKIDSKKSITPKYFLEVFIVYMHKQNKLN